MKRMINAIILSLALLLIVKPVSAEIQLDATSYPIQVNEPAPFTGVLLSPKAIAKIVVELKAIEDREKIIVERAVVEQQAKCNAALVEAKIKSDALLAEKQLALDSMFSQNSVLNQRVVDAEADESMFPYWLGGSFLAGIGISLLTMSVIR